MKKQQEVFIAKQFRFNYATHEYDVVVVDATGAFRRKANKRELTDFAKSLADENKDLRALVNIYRDALREREV